MIAHNSDVAMFIKERKLRFKNTGHLDIVNIGRTLYLLLNFRQCAKVHVDQVLAAAGVWRALTRAASLSPFEQQCPPALTRRQREKDRYRRCVFRGGGCPGVRRSVAQDGARPRRSPALLVLGADSDSLSYWAFDVKSQ
jgi:hypothetical protein